MATPNSELHIYPHSLHRPIFLRAIISTLPWRWNHSVLSRFCVIWDVDAKGTEEEERGPTREQGRQFSLYEFNPALSRHGLLFQACGGRHDDGAAARRCKRRILFCKCAPGNWSSCCSCVGSFYTRLSFAILIKTSRKEVPVAVQSTQKNRKRSSTIEIAEKNS